MKTRDRIAVTFLGLAALTAALWFLALAPKREQAADLTAKVTQAESRLEAASSAAATAEQARASYRRDYATFARLGKATPPKADVASLVYQLESAARDAKVDFRSLSSPTETAEGAGDQATAEKPASTTGITPVPFTFTFEGSFFKLRKLLRSVDRFSRLRGQKVSISGRLLTLDGIKLSPGRSGFPQVKVEIVARAYVAELPEPPPDGAPAPTSASTSDRP